MAGFVSLFVALLSFYTVVLAQVPSNYNILSLPPGSVPVIDGNIGEWPEAYFIDSLRSDNNIFARDALTPWTRSDFQYKVYIAHDENKVYFALKIIADDVVISGASTGCSDAFKINPGGRSTGFYLFVEGTVTRMPSCPFQLGTSLFAAVKPLGNGSFATAEFSVDKSVIDPFGMGTFQLNVGMEEGDTPPTDCRQTCYGGIGVYYVGNKQDWNANPWDNPLYYPIFSMYGGSGPALVTGNCHVFWYKAQTNGYNLQASNPGPGIPANAEVHEGLVMSAGVAQHSGAAVDMFELGSGLDDAQGRCGVVWFRDLCATAGSVTSAKFRTEYIDAWSGSAFCNAGPISIRCGVVDFQGNIDVWGSPDLVAETATWQDFLNPLGSTMGFDMMNPTMQAEETINITALAGRASDAEPSVLNGKFAEIDVTDQVNWILSHTGANKGSFSGQYAIAFLVTPGMGSTGKFWGYSSENCVRPAMGSDNPWTQDGNTAHLVLYGLSGSSSDTTRPVISNINVSSLTDSSVIINWTTNENSTSLVDFGTSTPYGRTATALGSVTSHHVTLTGLTQTTLYHYRVKSADASNNLATSSDFTFTTPVKYNAPVFISVPVTSGRENSPYLYRVIVTDVDIGDVVTLSLDTFPSGMALVRDTIRWTPLDIHVGSKRVVVRARDTHGLASFQRFNIIVANVNDRPRIVSTPMVTAVQGLLYAYQVQVIDSDLVDHMHYVLDTFPAGMTVNATGRISWTPGPNQVASYTVKLRVYDDYAAADTQRFTIAVSNVNDAPVIQSLRLDTALEDIPYSDSLKAVDYDGNPVFWYLLSGPESLIVDLTSGVVSWLPRNRHAGPQVLRVRATDGVLSDIDTVRIYVRAVNDPPVILTVLPDSFVVGKLYTLPLSAYDEEKAKLSWSIPDKPSNMTIIDTTLVWAPEASNLGRDTLTLIVTDGFKSDTQAVFFRIVPNIGAEIAKARVPVRLCLTASPNPFNPAVRIQVGVPADERGRLDLDLISVNGRVVNRWRVSGAGYHQIVWSAFDAGHSVVGNGMYLLRLTGGKKILEQRLLLLK